MPATVQFGYRPGCIGRIVELHAHFYHPRVGFGLAFESKVARELAAFCEHLDGGRSGLWLAMQDGVVEGSIAIDGSAADTEGAHLRWFITSERLRGSGAGTALLEAAMHFCAAQRFGSVYLWTFEGLDAARHLYEKSGFALVHQQRGAQWGVEVNEQRFELRAAPRE